MASSSFVTFDFTCGNFTAGNGYYSGSNGTNKTITQLLMKSGEKNCQVILQQKMVLYNIESQSPIPADAIHPDVDPQPSAPPREFEYRATSRWYTTIASGMACAAPIVIPMLMAQSSQKKQ
jgi:hypothetical protein